MALASATPTGNYDALKAMSPAPKGVEEAAPKPQAPMGRYGTLNAAHANNESAPPTQQPSAPEAAPAASTASATADLATGNASTPNAPAPANDPNEPSPANTPFMTRNAEWMNKTASAENDAAPVAPTPQRKMPAPGLA